MHRKSKYVRFYYFLNKEFLRPFNHISSIFCNIIKKYLYEFFTNYYAINFYVKILAAVIDESIFIFPIHKLMEDFYGSVFTHRKK